MPRPVRLLVLLLAVAAACAGPTEESHGPPPLLGALPRTLSAEESRAISGSNAFGFELLHRIRFVAPDSNHFLSPVSASMALGMALNGASGATLDSMRYALSLNGAPVDEINAGYRTLIGLLRNLDPSSQFQIANSIWSARGFPVLPAFVDVGRSSFDAEIQSLDFRSKDALGTINGWVNAKTHGKIPTILTSISDLEVMFLINAIYFKGSWRTAFDRARTTLAPFHAGDGATQSIATMRLEPGLQRYMSTRDFEMIELLYGNGAFAMDLVLPRSDRSLADVTAGLDAARWQEWVADLHDREFGIALPKFTLEYQRSLKDDLTALGMGIAFDDARADFSRLSTMPTYITKVIQKTFVDVNEEGTEAAAATAVGIGFTSAPPTVEINRPFLFAIRERLSGTILFLGQITRIP